MSDHFNLVNRLMFSYEDLSQNDFESIAKDLPLKIVRWLVSNHPDNRRRKWLLRLSNVIVGEETVINSGFVVSDDYKTLLTIGRRVAISPNVTIICASSPNNSNLLQLDGFKESYVKSEPVIIGDDSWIGAGAIVLPGVKIGQQVVVGAGSVVSKSISDGAVVVGVPGKVIKRLY